MPQGRQDCDILGDDSPVDLERGHAAASIDLKIIRLAVRTSRDRYAARIEVCSCRYERNTGR
jgi:hypothetical protein